jgi:hypothetical protein
VEPEVAVGLFVELFEEERVLEADRLAAVVWTKPWLRTKKTVVSYRPSATARSTSPASRRDGAKPR